MIKVTYCFIRCRHRVQDWSALLSSGLRELCLPLRNNMQSKSTW
jgi:hypothetical protein